MKILVANLPSFKGKKFIKEGRCSQSKKIWNTIWPPYSLVSIAAVLEKLSHEVKIFDYPAMKSREADFFSFIRGFSPEVVIASCTTPTVYDDLEACLKIKQILPGTKIIIFGIHGSIFSQALLKQHAFIDFIIRGEPEYTIRELIEALSGNQKVKFENIKGISFRFQGEIIKNQDRELITNLDDLPIPAWHLVDVKRYKLPILGKPYLMIVPGRGCVDKCLFCYAHAYYGQKNRRHSVRRVINEIVFNKKEFKIDHFFFWTENCTQDRKFLMDLLDQMIELNLNVKWACNSRVDTIDFELLHKMKIAGCLIVAFGVESGEQRILDISKKNINLKQIENAFYLTHKAGIQSIANCMFGLPGETIKSMKKTMKFLKKINPTYAQFYMAVPRPGSEFYELAQKEGWIQTNDWGKFHQGDYVLNINGLSRDDIVNFRKRAGILFYLDFKRLAGILINLFKAFFRGRQKA
ncbi:MAG: B12-binding domain-containing radical SAM protein [Candidatus Omnitrophica bacterium]|nr:B12-binding domain-containing radical SAM protein [Candidatus Omnitrophota bacterium]